MSEEVGLLLTMVSIILFTTCCFLVTYLFFVMHLMLLGEIIIHIMTPQMREYFKLEDRWEKSEVRRFNFLKFSSLYNLVQILDMNYFFPERPSPVRNALSPVETYQMGETELGDEEEEAEEDLSQYLQEQEAEENSASDEAFWK
jgi:hypothetical protein